MVGIIKQPIKCILLIFNNVVKIPKNVEVKKIIIDNIFP